MRRTLTFDGPTHGSDQSSSLHRAVVSLGASEASGHARLRIDGVATCYEVFLNDVRVAAGTSMWQRHDVSVTGLLRPEDNVVEIRVEPIPLDQVPSRPRARWRTRLVDEPRLRWVRTSLLGRAPGFSPGWPDQGPVVGPWLPVQLETGLEFEGYELEFRTRLDADAGGHVGVLMVEGSAIPVSKVRVAIGDVDVEFPVNDGRLKGELRLPGIARWWPHTHGEPALHDVTVTAGDVVLAQRRLGFRSVGNAASDGLDLLVNEVPVFVRGAVWTPGDLDALDQAARLGLNLVRVLGAFTYESEAFHARCDELGLMVWQDFMFATFDYPLADPDFSARVRAEAVDQISRWLPHPSTVVVCGSAEHEQQATMMGRPFDGAAAELADLLHPIVAEQRLDAIWVDSSPTGGIPVTRVDTGIGQYFGVGGYLRDLTDVRASGVRFASECLAFSNLPKGWPDSTARGVPRDNGASWDFADVRRHYLRQRYGPEATDEEAARVTGELMAAVFGEWRRSGSGCGGGIVLWLRDLESGAGWGLLDHEGHPKPAALVLAPVLQSTALWLVDEGLNGVDIYVACDRAETVQGELSVALVREDGTVLESSSRGLSLVGPGQLRLGVEELLGAFRDVSYAYRFGPPAHAAVQVRLESDTLELSAVLATTR